MVIAPSDVWARERARSMALYSLFGALSGSLAATLVAQIRVEDWISWVAPGLIFGLVIATALRRHGLAGPWRWTGFVVASTASHYAAVWLAIEFLHSLLGENMVLVGMAAGLAGSACLTVAAALLFRFVRRMFPSLLLLFAGAALGALLGVGDDFWGALLLYAGWQAGYAACLGLALPSGSPNRSPGRDGLGRR